MKRLLTLTLATLLVSLMSLYGTPTTEGVRQRLAGHIERLASCDLMGRKAGTEGALAAAEYIAGEFAATGLAPFGGEEYIHPFKELYGNVVGQIEGTAADTEGRFLSAIQGEEDGLVFVLDTEDPDERWRYCRIYVPAECIKQ